MEERRMSIAWTVLIWVLVVVPPAHAYLDPSTGGMIISALVGVVASLGLVLKSSWYRVRALFGRGDGRSSDRMPPSENPVDGDVGPRR
jgi:hypothetical protein